MMYLLTWQEIHLKLQCMMSSCISRIGVLHRRSNCQETGHCGLPQITWSSSTKHDSGGWRREGPAVEYENVTQSWVSAWDWDSCTNVTNCHSNGNECTSNSQNSGNRKWIVIKHTINNAVRDCCKYVVNGWAKDYTCWGWWGWWETCHRHTLKEKDAWILATTAHLIKLQDKGAQMTAHHIVHCNIHIHCIGYWSSTSQNKERARVKTIRIPVSPLG